MARQYKPRVVKYKIDGIRQETTIRTKKGAERLYNKLREQHNAVLKEMNKEQYAYGSAEGKTLGKLMEQIRYMAGVSRRGYVGMSTGRYKEYLERKINDALAIPMDDESYNEIANLQFIIENMSNYAFEKFYEFMGAHHKVNRTATFELEVFYSGKVPSIVDRANEIMTYLKEFASTLDKNSPIRQLIE